MQSALATVDRRCAIISTVLPLASWAKAACTFASLSGSAKAVASSKIRMGAFFSMARAMATRCCSPPERYTPLVPMTVWMPAGNFSTISIHCAAFNAASTSASVACGLPRRTLSRMLPLSRRLFWNTKEMVSISSSLGIARTSAPPTRTLPLCTSKNRQTRFASVDLPPPEGPTKATVCPG